MFKVGDEVVLPLKIEKICNEELVGAKSEADVTYLFKIEEANRVLKPRESKTYAQGLADAWELLKKVYDMKCETIEQIFDVEGGFWDVIRDFTYEEALAKIEAYEKGKPVCVGDVVECNGFKGVVLHIFHSGSLNIVYENGIIDTLASVQECEKTGKHIDIESLLKQIGE